MMTRIAEFWCKAMHGSAMWPIHGRYICPKCLREYSVVWEGPPPRTQHASPALRHAVTATADGYSAAQ